MMRACGTVVLLAVILGQAEPIQADPYDDAPDFILNAGLSEMTNPPSYNLYAKFEKTKIPPIDIWYRLKFNDSGVCSERIPVYATRVDSALIRSMNDFPSWGMFRPGKDTSLHDIGYLVRMGMRNWTGQCDFQSVPDPYADTARKWDVMPVMLRSDSVALPRLFFRPGFVARTTIKYYVNEFGDVCSAYVLQSSGCALFDLFSLDVAESWHYLPALSKGEPVGIWLNWNVSTEEEPGQDSVSSED